MGNMMKGKALLLRSLLVWLVSLQAFTPVMSRSLEGGVADKKGYYSPDPHGGSPHHSHETPCTTTPPSSGGSGGGDPSNGTPPTPSHSGGGGDPSNGTPPTPSHSGGGGSPVITTPPSPVVPLVPPSPTTYPLIPTPPATPMIPDPNSSPPFTCDYWRSHPAAIWVLFGYWCPLSQIFGLPAASAFGRNPSLLEALSNTRSDGIGALYREGTASFLNSLVNRNFFFTSQQVRDAFNAAVVSDKDAAAQAELFKRANEDHLKRY